jgi:hypothetical protein
MNQCDGCCRGLPLSNGIHRGEGYDLIGCAAHLYATAVYEALDERAKKRTSQENVADVLGAYARLLKENQQ